MRYNTSIEWITVHCTATTANLDIGAREIRQWHLARHWRDIGYHFVIRRNGEIETGRPIYEVGAHVKEHNKGNLGVCLVGGTDADKRPQDNFTLAQRKSLFRLIEQLQTLYGITDDHVKPHHEWNSNKACPVIQL